MQGEVFGVQDLLTVTVGDEKPERLGFSVQGGVPLGELVVRPYFELYLDVSSRNWLHEGRDSKARELLKVVVNHFTHPGLLDQLTELLGRKVRQVLPAELLLALYSPRDLVQVAGSLCIVSLEHGSELADRC